MDDLKKILVPVDFSACSAAALRDAIGLAKRYGAEVEALHVHEPPHSMAQLKVTIPGRGPDDLVSLLRDQASRMFDAMLAELEHPVIRTMVAGTPEQVIVQRAKDGDYDLLVMGTHGRRGLKHFLMGSVTERVLRLAPLPVLVVRDHYTDG